jgi:hypothetical protein
LGRSSKKLEHRGQADAHTLYQAVVWSNGNVDTLVHERRRLLDCREQDLIGMPWRRQVSAAHASSQIRHAAVSERRINPGLAFIRHRQSERLNQILGMAMSRN